LNLVIFDAKSVGLVEGKEVIKLRTGFISDLSDVGLKIETNDLNEEWLFHLLSGSILLALKFCLPGGKNPVNAVAQAIWIKHNAGSYGCKYVLGIRFTEMKKTDKDLLNQFIAERRADKNKNNE
jgi:hypothetical protein